MDVYVARTYEVDRHEDRSSYPFWDYRSRRCGQARGQCPSYKETCQMRPDLDYTGQMGSPDEESVAFNLDPCRVTLHIIADPHELCPLVELYQPIINFVDPKLKLFRVTERSDPAKTDNNRTSGNTLSETPALAIMVFLRGSEPEVNSPEVTSDRLRSARKLFQHRPWRFHHREKLNQEKLNTMPDNSQDYFYTSRDLPLWALRHVHYGRQHVRYVLYTDDGSWSDQVQFYQLIFGLEPDLIREDFCLFTVYKSEEYDVQFALKKQSQGMSVVRLDSLHIQVKVRDVGQLVPLFPNVCRPISDVKWQTTDHDGNMVILDVVSSKRYPLDHKRKATSKPSNKRPDLSVQTSGHHLYRCHQLSEDSDFHSMTSPTDDTSAPFAFGRSDLYIINNSHPAAGTFVFDPSASDLDIDLPSLTTRVRSRPEEDQESLTLTNTSEESGIHMQQLSEDLSFADDEPLRPCLATSRHRQTKLRVRFKDEVEAFEEDTQSQHSSGIDSEGMSDSEMETRFSFVPLPKEVSSCLGNNNSLSCGDRSGVQVSKGHPRGDASCKTSRENYHNVVESLNANGNQSAGIISPKKPPPVLPKPRLHNNHNNPCLTSSQEETPSLLSRHNCVQNSSCAHNAVSNIVDKSAARPPNVTTPPSYFHACSRTQSPSRSHHKTDTGEPSTEQNSGRASVPNRPSTKASGSQPTIPTPPPIRLHATIPPPPPVRGSQTKLRSVSANAPPVSQSLKESAPNQNEHRKFYFADSTSNFATAIGSKNIIEEDTTLKFTLKYDTCPTSGLSSRQEQIGFYV
ncbi:unnamed protein product [Lymnaea stagnalis]|uniref:FAM124 domain-containing protein n=1 Tax=Lymnaea stagnalis TaxID=6523 RepID=A0AAV2HH13_LYMST